MSCDDAKIPLGHHCCQCAVCQLAVRRVPTPPDDRSNWEFTLPSYAVKQSRRGIPAIHNPSFDINMAFCTDVVCINYQTGNIYEEHDPDADRYGNNRTLPAMRPIPPCLSRKD